MAADSSDHPAADGAAYRTLSSKTVYRNNWMRVREDTFARPDGVVDTYGVVDKEDFAIVIAESGDGGFHLVEQFRYAIGKRSWEFPMGTWGAGHSGSVDELAKQELLEETGVRAASWRRIGGHVQQAGGFCSQGFDLFHATELTDGEHEREESEADMVQALVSEAEFRRMIRDGQIVDAVTIAAYALLRLLG
jgi:8-oxo-dGTP pyrophosphatase MutT (NUDIX family)